MSSASRNSKMDWFSCIRYSISCTFLISKLSFSTSNSQTLKSMRDQSFLNKCLPIQWTAKHQAVPIDGCNTLAGYHYHNESYFELGICIMQDNLLCLLQSHTYDGHAMTQTWRIPLHQSSPWEILRNSSLVLRSVSCSITDIWHVTTSRLKKFCINVPSLRNSHCRFIIYSDEEED